LTRATALTLMEDTPGASPPARGDIMGVLSGAHVPLARSTVSAATPIRIFSRRAGNILGVYPPLYRIGRLPWAFPGGVAEDLPLSRQVFWSFAKQNSTTVMARLERRGGGREGCRPDLPQGNRPPSSSSRGPVAFSLSPPLRPGERLAILNLYHCRRLFYG
jgi:hypothetical protein